MYLVQSEGLGHHEAPALDEPSAYLRVVSWISQINLSINVVIKIYHGPGGGGGRGGEPEWVGEPESAHLDGEVDVVDGSVELGEAGLPLRDGGVSGDGLQWSRFIRNTG